MAKKPRKIYSKKTYGVMLAVFALVFAAAIIALLFYNGILQINNPKESEYPIRGVDVSSYQGDIDWPLLASQDIDFVYMKATEGSEFTDKCFEYNHTEALKTHLRVGAYHFFSFESDGETQAEHFINTVPKTENMLPPAIDLEFYGDFAKNPKTREEVNTELDKMLLALEAHYGIKPIIYATESSYDAYLSGGYNDYGIWIRGVYSKPSLSDGRSFDFWQYSNRMTLNGYNGEEKFIDMNLFNGTKEEFNNYPFE